jgi:hypothetical protein
LKSSALHGLYWKVIGWYFLLSIAMGFYFGLAALVASLFAGSSIHGPSAAASISKSIPMIVMIVIGYLALILSLNVVLRVCLLRDLWTKVAQTTSVHNIGATANVSAKGELAGALGEGFADGLDVAGF